MSDIVELRNRELSAQPFRRAASGGLVNAVKDMKNNSQLLRRLVHREVRAKYKDSFFGFLWSYFKPLVQLLIYTLAIGEFLGAARSIPSFAIFVFTGLTTWQLFADIITTSTASLVVNSGIISKSYVPRELFPLSATIACIITTGAQILVLLAAALLTDGLPSDARLLYLPAAVLVTVVWGLAIGLILAPANVYLRDVQYLIEVALLAGFWLSPIVYSYGQVSSQVQGLLLEIYTWNPITLVTFASQRGVWLAGEGNPAPDHLPMRLLVVFFAGVVALLFAHAAFQRLQRNIAQEM